MGILCDLFVATSDDARAYETYGGGDYEARRHKYSPMEFKRLTSLEFGTLWAILEQKQWDASRHMLLDIDFSPDKESWLHRFQDDYLVLLSRMEVREIDGAAALWAKTEEINADAQDVRPVVEALVDLAKDALATNQGLYMWGSL